MDLNECDNFDYHIQTNRNERLTALNVPIYEQQNECCV